MTVVRDYVKIIYIRSPDETRTHPYCDGAALPLVSLLPT